MRQVITRHLRRIRQPFALAVALLVALSAQALGVSSAAAHPDHAEATPFNALLFSKTAAFRHGSIESGIAAIESLATENGFTVDATEDAADFTDENLAGYDVVIFLSTTGDVLNAQQQGAFERYIEGGGGYAGIHAASDTEYDWPWYGDLVGAYFKGHPAQQDATVKVEDPAHPSTAGMSPTWDRFDEWYNYLSNPRGDVHVLASLDESTYNGGDMGVEHPISWCQDYRGGRSWYTGMGHTDASFADPQFRHHLLGGIRTAAGVEAADCSATLPESFEKIALDDNTANPMELDIAPDGRVVYVDRNGEVKIVLPNGNVVKAGELDVYTGQEFGMLGVALDPDFETNNWVYLYYSPAGSEAIDRVSRIELTGNTLDMTTKKDVLEISVQRNQCCHAGGAMEFDNDGNLYIATGDNTNPFASDGYAPIDERDGRSAWDAQRTSANTDNLNGKVLRITPTADGGYDIPEGNLFAEGVAKTRPEIYAMGFRNPFRIGLNEQTGKLLVADYGPDAGSANANRGPDGRVEWNILSEPGFYGWPYCVSDNVAYNDRDFAAGTSGGKFDCSAPVNDSPNNTGLTELPAAIPSTVWQGKSSTGVPEIGGSGAPMTSGTYAYDAELDSERKWPAYFDGKAIWADWNNSRLFTVQLNEAGTDYTDVNRFLPDLPMTRPHALQFGPDGALYMIEWGSGFGGNNADSGIYRIDYVQGNRAPIARATADRTSGPAPLEVAFDSAGSRDPDGTPVTFAWDFDGDGSTDSTEATPTHTYTEVGNYTARLTVTDEDGRTAVSNIDIVVGNTAPEVELVLPVDGGFFEFGDTMKYEVVVTDPEDGEIDCDRVVVQPALGHDEHAHGYEQYTGCSGTLPLPGDEGHVGANIFGTITATYTDGGGAGGVAPLDGQDTVVLHTKRTEAEFFDSTGRLEGSTSPGAAGVIRETAGDSAGGGQNVGYIEPGDWFGWDVMNLTDIDRISLRAASPQAAGATWEVRTGSPDGPTVATIEVPRTGGWQTYDDFSAEPTGDSTTVSGPLYFVETAGGSNINWVDFIGTGVTDNRRPEVTASADPVTGTAPLEVDFSASATDPDGDEPISFEWVFGDGGTADTADPTHTFTEPGTYQATVTATDARGAKASTKVEIKVLGELDTCFTGRSDDFLGDALDTDRWDSVVRGNDDLTVSDGQLSIPLTATDIYGPNGTPTPNIVLQHLPGGAFEVTSKVTLPARRQYQQAGLIVYGDDNNYMKMVIQGRTGSPSAAGRVFQFASELGGRATETNTAALGDAFPDTFWVRLTSPDGLDVSASYSVDGLDFTPMEGSRSLAGINEPRVGLFGLANRDEALPITAHFDNFRISPDDSAEPCDGPDDTTAPKVDTTVLGEYAGDVESLVDTPIAGTATLTSSLEDEGRSTTATLALTGLEPGAGYESHLHEGTCETLGLHYRDDPEGDGTPPNELWPTGPGWEAGQPRIVADASGEAVAEATVPWAPRTDGRALVLHRDGGIVACATLDLTGPGTVVLDASDDTGVESLEYRLDDGDWTDYTEPVSVDRAGDHVLRWRASDAAGNESSGSVDVTVPDTTDPTLEVTVDPESPDGQNGWWTSTVTLSATASDEGPGPVTLEFRVDDGDWTTYESPVRIDRDGSHEVVFRALDEAGNVARSRHEVRRDATDPTVSVSGIRDGAVLSVEETRSVVVTAADGTSGVDSVQLTLDGEAVTSPVLVDAVALLSGDHTLRVQATDVAGNRTTRTVEFTVRASFDGGYALIDRLVEEDLVTAKQAKSLRSDLLAARKASNKGKSAKAVKVLDAFIETAGEVGDDLAQAALVDLAEQLKADV
ncbi:ThuA domain-containing protein [Nocardioides donggukensis]|uniref:ThuA domain-containing protein n=1 Tax=Nocardioides donggukensis TaxID=2774019 RepID=A0A927K536_9ACTN|nr:ThuA domain-containing protein [Nocardioides donggukensis]MBD8870412.1 ThuA domain-containing protein [Nocardioides donggukensis]